LIKSPYIKKIIELSELGLIIWIIIYLPFVNHNGLFQGNQSSKLVWALSIVALCYPLWGLKLYMQNSIRLSLTLPDFVLGFFWLYLFLNRLYFSGASSYSIAYGELIFIGLLYPIIRSISTKHHFFLLYGVMLSGLFQAFYGLLQVYGYYPSNHPLFKITGGFFNPAPYSGFILSTMGVALCFIIYKKTLETLVDENIEKSFEGYSRNWLIASKHLLNDFILFIEKNFNAIFSYLKCNNPSYLSKKIISKLFRYIFIFLTPICSFLLIIIVLPATQSRAAWIGAIGVLFFIMLTKFKLENLFKNFAERSKIWVILAFLIIFVGSISLLAGTYYLKKDSADGRLLIWRISADMIKDKPLLGHGFEMFRGKYMNYQERFFSEKAKIHLNYELLADDNRYAFNDVLKTWIETGLPGVILFLGIVYWILKSNAANFGSPGQGLIRVASKAGVTGIIIFSFFSYPSEILPIKVHLVIFLSLLSAQCKPIVEPVFTYRTDRHIAGMLIAIMVFIITYKTYSAAIDLKWTYRQWQSALDSYTKGSYNSSVKQYQGIYDKLSNEGEFLGHFGKALSVYGEHQEAIEVLTKAEGFMNNSLVQLALGDSYKAIGQFKKAELAYKKAHYMVPVRFYPLYQLAKLYIEINDYESAVQTAKTILEKKVKVHSSAIEQIREEMKIILEENNHNCIRVTQ
jgi:O-antigen polymerase